MWNTNGGNNTQDRVFLLSYAEAVQYFGFFGAKADEYNKELRLSTTPHVAASMLGILNYNGSGGQKTADGEKAVMWWLRSPGSNQKSAAIVYSAGNLASNDVNDNYLIVRPAFWLDLNADIF